MEKTSDGLKNVQEITIAKIVVQNLSDFCIGKSNVFPMWLIIFDMPYDDPLLLLVNMLKELDAQKDDKSRAITYWSNITSLLKKIYEIKFKTKKLPKKRDDLLDALENSYMMNNNLRKDIDHLAKIRGMCTHEDSISMLSQDTKNSIEKILEKSYYVQTRSKETEFRKYPLDRKTGLLADAIFQNLSLSYKKLVKPELFDASEYGATINGFQY